MATTGPWIVRVSPTWLRASYHQIAPPQAGAGVAVGSGAGVPDRLPAMMRCTSATAVRRTLVACTSGAVEAGESTIGGAQARVLNTSTNATVHARMSIACRVAKRPT